MADGQDQVLCDSGERFRALLERYKLALAAGRTTVWEWDAATNTISTDEHILSEMLGFAVREGYTVTDWVTAVHPEDRDRVFCERPALRPRRALACGHV